MSISKRLREAGATSTPLASWRSDAERTDAGPVSVPTAAPSSRTRARPDGFTPPTPAPPGQQVFHVTPTTPERFKQQVFPFAEG